MIKVLKKIYHFIKNKYIFLINKNKIDPKIGLSFNEINRLRKHERMVKGEAKFFNQNFIFSNSGSFLHSVEEIFKDEVYKFKTDSYNPYIIDCGANIGLSILYFTKNYPNAEILAFEPDHEIFQILKQNIESLSCNSSIIIKEEAVWKEDTTLEFFSDGGLSGSLFADFANKKNIIKIKAADLKKYLNKKVDFLKMDIEGAENEVIFDIKNQLHYVENLFLEYHGIKDKKQNLGDILNLLTEEGFQYYIRVAGETMSYPFFKEVHGVFNQQLNIFCFRK